MPLSRPRPARGCLLLRQLLALAVLVCAAALLPMVSAQDPTLGTSSNPIKFGVSASMSNAEVTAVQNFFDTFKLDSFYVNAVRSTDQISGLQSGLLDVSVLDAAQGYLAWRRFAHQVRLTSLTFDEICRICVSGRSSDCAFCYDLT